MNKSKKIWFVPLSHLLQEGGATLIPAESPIQKGRDQCVENGSPFTISLESYCIFKKLDRQTGNDLLVRSWTTYGDDYPVEIVHSFEKNVKPGAIKENLVVEHIFASQNYDNKPVTVELQILEIEGQSEITDNIKAVSGVLGAVFPAVIPFMGKLAVEPLLNLLQGVLKNKNPDDLAFQGVLKFQETSSAIPLRCGAYVLFMNAQGERQYKLRDFKLEPASSNVLQEQDYIVIKVVPRIVHSFNTEMLLANQRLAAELLQKDIDNTMSENIKAVISKVKPLRDLQHTIKHAILFDSLKEYRTLREKYKQLQDEELDTIHKKEFYNIKERLQEIKQKLAQDIRMIIGKQ